MFQSLQYRNILYIPPILFRGMIYLKEGLHPNWEG